MNTQTKSEELPAREEAPGVRYVCGFMFDEARQKVALIRKEKPAWQRGKLNGIGGKVEPWEDSLAAMVREFAEESGVETVADQWLRFLIMHGQEDGGWTVEFYATFGDLAQVRTNETEPVEVISLDHVWPTRPDMIENLPWLLPLALDFLDDGRPGFVDARYS